MKKMTAILIALLLCLSLVSCSGEVAPDGMQSATIEGEPFYLYVPSSWTPNTASGISSAYFSLTDKIIVTARYFTPDDEAMTLEDYVTLSADSYAESITGKFELKEQSASILGGQDAQKLVYGFENDGTAYTATQYFTKYNGDMISLSFYATGEAMTDFSENVEDIVTNFTLREKTPAEGDNVTDRSTPEGMKIASSNVVEYRLYVPTAWICSSESGVSEAYYPESDKTNVTVTSYSPNEEITLEEYFALCDEGYANTLTDYLMLSTLRGAEVAGKEAIDFVFSANYDGRAFKIRQVVMYSAETGLFYNFTYTATAESYKLHLDDFEAMLDSFTFR